MSIAFCFLLKNKIQNNSAWGLFFKDAVNYNIYTHIKEITNETQDWVKQNKIKKWVDTKWGDYSLFEATLYLYEEALKNKNNKFIVLLSDACIPVHDYKTIYEFITKVNKSLIDYKYIGNYDNIRFNAYGASQWMLLTRVDALSLCRLLDPLDSEATTFKKFWINETENNDGFMTGYWGADEIIPINWFIYVYGYENCYSYFDIMKYDKRVKTSIESPEFKKHIQYYCMTYAYFKKYGTSPSVFTSIPKNTKEICKCLFARKFENLSIICPNKLKIRRKSSIKKWWGQP